MIRKKTSFQSVVSGKTVHMFDTLVVTRKTEPFSRKDHPLHVGIEVDGTRDQFQATGCMSRHLLRIFAQKGKRQPHKIEKRPIRPSHFGEYIHESTPEGSLLSRIKNLSLFFARS